MSTQPEDYENPVHYEHDEDAEALEYPEDVEVQDDGKDFEVIFNA